MDLSIIVVNWNTREILDNCLASVYASHTTIDYDVWVVDNNSSDGSVQMIEEKFPHTHVIPNETNAGFARGNNQAIMESSADYVMLLNPDTIMEGNVLQGLFGYLEEHPDVGAAGPRLLNPDGTLQESAYPEPTLWREFWRLFHLDLVKHYGAYPMAEWSISDPRDVDVLMGACFLVRRKVLDQVGLLDEEFFVYSEEVDFCKRIRDYGWRIGWFPAVKVTHLGGQSTRQVQQEMFLQLYQGKIQYFRKHNPIGVVWAYKFVLFTAAIVRLAMTPVAFFEDSAEKDEHLKLSGNYRRLLSSLPGL
jgi:GT2 family glycosyltransferase